MNGTKHSPAPERKEQAGATPGKPMVFNVRAVFALAADRMYRVYLLPGELCFIKVGGQQVFGEGSSHVMRRQLGLIGGLISLFFEKKQKERLAQKTTEADRSDPRSQLQAHKHNFLAQRIDFLATSIEPGGFQTHGQNFGIWKVHMRGNKRMRLQFETLDDMQVALDHLPRFFYPRMQVKVEWSEKYKTYVKRK